MASRRRRWLPTRLSARVNSVLFRAGTSLAREYARQGHLDRARFLMDQAATRGAAAYGDDDRVLHSAIELAMMHVDAGDAAAAAQLLGTVRALIDGNPGVSAETRLQVTTASLTAAILTGQLDEIEEIGNAGLEVLTTAPPSGQTVLGQALCRVALAMIELRRNRPGAAVRQIDAIPTEALDYISDPAADEPERHSKSTAGNAGPETPGLRLVAVAAMMTMAEAFAAAGQRELAVDLVNQTLPVAAELFATDPVAGAAWFPWPPASMLVAVELTAARLLRSAGNLDAAWDLLQRAIPQHFPPATPAIDGLMSQVEHLRSLIEADRAADITRAREALDRPLQETGHAEAFLTGPDAEQRWVEAQATLAAIEHSFGQPLDALTRARQALPLAQKANSPDNPWIARLLETIACGAAATGEFAPALEAARTAAELDCRQLQHNAGLCGRSEFGELVDQHFARLNRYLTACVAAHAAGHADAASTMLAIVIQRQGIELETFQRRHRYGSGSETGQALRLVNERIAALSVGGAEAPRDDLVNLLAQRHMLEMRLAVDYATMAGEDDHLPSTTQLHDALPAGTGLLQIQCWVPADLNTGALTTKSVQYLGLLAIDGRVQLLRFGALPTIDRLVARLKDDLAQASATPSPGRTDATIREQLGGLLAEPLRAAIADSPVRHLLIAPDGLLGLIPWVTLPDASGRSIGADWTVSFVTSARRLARGNRPHLPGHRSAPDLAPAPADEAVVIAAPDYGPTGRDLSAWRSVQAQFPEGFPALPGARQEGNEVARLLGTVARTGSAATRELLVGLGSPRVLHIATHGFYLDDDDVDLRRSIFAGLPDDATQSTDSRLMWLTLPMPLLRCGLALAGANRVADPAIPHGGVVTGEDIAQLDLQATELVVLSGCHTGLGDVRVQEGIIGLVYAFSIAGAKAVLVSLWKVHDELGRQLMVSFYENYRHHNDPVFALRAAQHRIATENPDPFCWAGFVLYL